MKKRSIALVSALLVLASACSSEPAPRAAGSSAETPGSAEMSPSNGTRVSIAGFAFDPKTLEVGVGDTIVWTNEDDIAHTVTSGRAKKQGVPGVSENRDAVPDGVFDSGTMELDDTFEFTPKRTGTVEYFCAIHAGMSARIVVS